MKPEKSDQDSLMDQALAFLKAATSGDKDKAALPPVDFGPTAEEHKKDQPDLKGTAEVQQPDLLVERTLSIVQKIVPAETVSAPESERPKGIEPNTEPTVGGLVLVLEAPAEQTSRQQLLVENTLTLVKKVLVPEPNPMNPAPKIQQPKVEPVHEIKFEDRLTFERNAAKERVAKFRETQQRFQREREEYYAKTMASARATQWATPSEMPESQKH